jgi:type I restriction enzyme S subunit
VRRVEALFALADQLETRWYAAQGYVESLTPSLLAKAFRGELVLQDPNDEAADKLLERILSARTTQSDKPNRESKSKETREPTMTEETVKEVIRNMPRDTFTFDELQKSLSGEYEQIKDIVFNLLNQENPIIVQQFDSAAQLIRFIRRQE